MKKKFIILFFSLVFSQNFRENVELFTLENFIKPSKDDKLEIVSIMQIPNLSLQFIKSDIFKANFQASIVILNDDVILNQNNFEKQITAERFNDTVSRRIVTILKASNIVENKNKIFSTFYLKDLDTKNDIEKKEKINLDSIHKSQSLTIYQPIFFKKIEGEWGFGQDLFPTNIERVEAVDNELIFNQYFGGFSGNYSIRIELLDKSKKVIWSDEINDKILSDNFDFKPISIPYDKIPKGQEIGIKINLSHNNLSTSKLYSFGLLDSYKYFGIPNLDQALEQMIYIYSAEERKEYRDIQDDDKEIFFKKIWAKRDPDRTTKENELLEEYFKRVSFADSQFSRGSSLGWRSDMGMIYILFGKPDEISRNSNIQGTYNIETWYYNNVSKNFVFIDRNGFGNYELDPPFFY
jgi:GWxTD domain-containing protein